jgi:hypothetical protein
LEDRDDQPVDDHPRPRKTQRLDMLDKQISPRLLVEVMEHLISNHFDIENRWIEQDPVGLLEIRCSCQDAGCIVP